MHRIIASLHVSDSERITAHLLRLAPEDRSLRFSAGAVTDETIRAYVDRIRFGSDLVLGLLSQRGLIFGLGHGCVFMQQGQLQIEVAFSVDAAWRGFGLGKALMAEMQTQISERVGAPAHMVGMCAARNWPMRHIFERAGLSLEREDDEMHAHGWVSPRLPLQTLHA